MMTRPELLKHLGISVSTLKRYVAKGMPIERGPGRRVSFDPEACAAWVAERSGKPAVDAGGRLNQPTVGQRADVGTDDRGDSVIDATLALRREQWLLARQKRERQAEQLVTIETAVESTRQTVQVIRAALLALPHRLRARCPNAPPEWEAEVDDCIRKSLRELAAVQPRPKQVER